MHPSPFRTGSRGMYDHRDRGGRPCSSGSPFLALLVLFTAQLTIVGGARAQTADLPGNLWDLLVTGPYTSVQYEWDVLDGDGDRQIVRSRSVFGRGERQVTDAGWVVFVSACTPARCSRGQWSEREGIELTGREGSPASPQIPRIGEEAFLKKCRKDGSGMRGGEVFVVYRCKRTEDEANTFYVNPDERSIAYQDRRDDRAGWTESFEYQRWVTVGPLRVPTQIRSTGESDDGLSYSATRTLESLQPNVPYDANDYSEAWVRSRLERYSSR